MLELLIDWVQFNVYETLGNIGRINGLILIHELKINNSTLTYNIFACAGFALISSHLTLSARGLLMESGYRIPGINFQAANGADAWLTTTVLRQFRGSAFAYVSIYLCTSNFVLSTQLRIYELLF